jgi:hypothetical protein
MTTAPQPIGFFAGFRRMRSLKWIFVAVVLAVAAAPGTADARKARRAPYGGGYDGFWNVLIATEAGPCDRTYNFPVTISGGRISAGGMARVSGRVGRGGDVVVRVAAGGSAATGSGRLGAGFGAGRWVGRGPNGVCSGRWQAARG